MSKLKLSKIKEDKKNNIEYILLAEFDIDKGSIVKHQYPEPCPVSESILADLMLPEGAHLRDQDWTVFFLRDSDADSPPKRRMTKSDKWLTVRTNLKAQIDRHRVVAQVLEYSESGQDWFIFHSRANISFSYAGGWNVSNEKLPDIKLLITDAESPSNVYSSTVINGEMQFTLLSEPEKFCSFYPPSGNAVGLKFENAEDMKSTQALISQILNPEKKPVVESDTPVEKAKRKLTEPLVCLNLVRTQKDSTVRRGAVVKALAICTRLQILESFKPLLITALDNYFLNESETGLSVLYLTLNEAEFDPNAERGIKRQISFYLQGPSSTDETYSVPVLFHGITMPLIVPHIVGPDEITGVSVVKFFTTFRKHLALIYNAVFTQKRILYLGHNQPAETVCQMVLATCLLISPSIEGTLKRAYPYACLTAMQFLQVPGYIAGVTNPIFEQREEWWDICCDISTGEVKCAEMYRNELDGQPLYAKTIAYDRTLINEVKHGISMKYGEKWIRAQFQDHTEHIVKMALGEEVFPNDNLEKDDWQANDWRVMQWKKTTSFMEAAQRQRDRILRSPFTENTLELETIVRTLQMRPVVPDDARSYFNKIDSYLDNEEKADYLFNLLRPSLGGMFPLVTYLYHSDAQIQDKVVDILMKLEQYSQTARRRIQMLNFFFVMTYEGLKKTKNVSKSKDTNRTKFGGGKVGHISTSSLGQSKSPHVKSPSQSRILNGKN